MRIYQIAQLVISCAFFYCALKVSIHCRGGLNPSENTRKSAFVDVFGRKHSAPTADETLFIALI